MVTQTPAGMSDMLGVSAPIKYAPDVVTRPVSAAELDAAADLADLKAERDKLRSMAAVVRQGGTVMPVAAEVAHAQEIGRRELDRRRARRKAAAKARKRARRN